MKGIGPGMKQPNGWYIRLWPNPGLAVTRKGSRYFIRLFSSKTAPGAKRLGIRRTTGR